jgi:hypothetical protein
MNFAEVVLHVLQMVKRPDKVIEIRKAVNQALTFACMTNNFARDMQERSVAIDPTAYAQSILLSEFVRFRKFAYIKPDNRKNYVFPMDADKIFAKGVELTDRYYIAGDQVNFKLARCAPNLLVGWFSHPPVLTEASGDFWLLGICPYAIIDKAASLVFKSIGDDASARQKEQDYNQQMLVIASDLTYGAQHG